MQNNVSNVQGNDSNVEVEFGFVFLSSSYDLRAYKEWQPYVDIGLGS